MASFMGTNKAWLVIRASCLASGLFDDGWKQETQKRSAFPGKDMHSALGEADDARTKSTGAEVWVHTCGKKRNGERKAQQETGY